MISLKLIYRGLISQRALDQTAGVDSNGTSRTKADLEVFFKGMARLVVSSKYLDEYSRLKLLDDLEHAKQKTTKAVDGAGQAEIAAIATKAEQEAETMVNAFAVFFPVLVDGKVAALEVITYFFDNQKIVEEMTQHLWDEVKRSSSATLGAMQFMSLERRIAEEDKTKLDNENWNDFKTDKFKNAYDFQTHLHSQLKEYYKRFWVVSAVCSSFWKKYSRQTYSFVDRSRAVAEAIPVRGESGESHCNANAAIEHVSPFNPTRQYRTFNQSNQIFS